ncbi:MAG: DUF2997 domain-containing protein [Cyanobacteria bacterium J06607_13]
MTYQPQVADDPLEAVIQIDVSGNFNLDVLNGDGKNCREFTDELEQGLGMVDNREAKPEYYESGLTNTQSAAAGQNLQVN